VPTLILARYLVPITTPPLEDGALLISEGKILRVGFRKDLTAASSGAAVIDFGDAVILPPFVNAHTHLELTHFPDWVRESASEAPEPNSFVDWILHVIRVKRGLTPERYVASLAAGIEASLAAGTGAVGDILSCFSARDAYRNSPIRGRLYLETLGHDPVRVQTVLDRIDAILTEQQAGHLRLGIAPHSTFTLSTDSLRQVFDFARQRRVPTTLHLAESPEEARFIRDSAGPIGDTLYPFVGWQTPTPRRSSPTVFAEACGALSPDCLLAHGVQLDEGDAERLARAGSTVVFCPRSNARLGVGTLPVERYRQAGIPLAIGTDSLASNDSLSLWEEIAFAEQWLVGRVNPSELLAMATHNGARALGLASKMGELKAGAGGNFQVLKISELPSLKDLQDFLCTVGSNAEVTALYLAGHDVLQMG